MIPSLLQIPSAVSDSKLHSVLPNNGKGDFQFERSTGATRINKDGLIEEVGYFSSELVQNGNFSELGSELTSQPINLINDFNPNGSTTIIDADTFNSTGGSLDGIASKTGEFSLTVGKTYKIEIQGNTTSSGFTLGAGNGNGDEYGSGFGTHYFVSLHAQLWIRQRTVGVTNITSLSIKQVDPNDRWVLGNGSGGTAWSITDKAIYDHSATSGPNTNSIHQSGLNLESGKKYKLTFDVTTTGSTAFWIGNSAGSVNYEGGTYRTFTTGYYCVQFDMPSDQTTLAFFNNNSDATLDNISLVEVQGDRPRLSYDITNGVVEKQPHLLLENSSTNRITFSEDLSNNWTTANTTVTTNQITSPDGALTADLLQSTSTSSCIIEPSGLSLTTGVTYTYSVFVKKGNNRWIRLGHISSASTGCWFDLDNGVVGTVNSESATIEKFGNNWYRITNTFVATSTATANSAFIGICNDNGSTNSGAIGQNVYIWGAMVEQQAFATSYIKTAGTTITRAAETCNNSKPSVNSTEGVLYCEIAALSLNDDTFREITLNDGTLNNVVELRYNNVDNQIQFVVRDGGSVTVNSQVAFSDVLEYNKIAFQYKANDFKVFANGSKVATDTAGSVPSGLNQLDFSWNETNKFYGKVKGLAVYNEALSESQLMQITGVTASSIYNNFVTRTASFTVEALNEVKKVIDNL